MQNRLGILGFGVVGKSALRFFKRFYKSLDIALWDERILSSFEDVLLKKYGVKRYVPFLLKNFLDDNYRIFVSPGFSKKYFRDIDENQILCELDLFSEFYKKPVVAITGSLGKTTITSFLNDLSCSFGLKSFACGNIGNPLLDIITLHKAIDIAFLELSSFQLKFSKKFSPNIAVFNNFYSNHLDWHEELKDYFESKCRIFEYQNKDQFSLFPLKFLDKTFLFNKLFLKKIYSTNSNVCFIGYDFKRDFKQIKLIRLNSVILFSIEKDCLFFYKINKNKVVYKKEILNLDLIPEISFKNNWFFIIAVLYLLASEIKLYPWKEESLSSKEIKNELLNFKPGNLGEHRLELFLTKNNIDFYNDSKSTVYQATIQAVNKLSKKRRPIILILGGLNKGVDRTPLVRYLNEIKTLKKIFCFGLNCKCFSSFQSYSSLEEVINIVFEIMEPGDQILFSPSGSSFDLFKNYQERGNLFKDLVLNKTLDKI